MRPRTGLPTQSTPYNGIASGMGLILGSMGIVTGIWNVVVH